MMPIALTVIGSMLALYGLARRAVTPASVRRTVRPSAVLRLVADLLWLIVETFVFAAFAFGPRHAKYPRPLGWRGAKDVVAGRASSRHDRRR
jgi:hypothetical protein